MGLIQMAKTAISSNLQDQVIEYFRCDGMKDGVLCTPATKVKRGNVVNNGQNDYISNGSVFDVSINQAALLVEDGKVWDMVIADTNERAGQYKYDTTLAPSILGAGLHDVIPSIKDIAKRFTAGGQATHTMRLVYINLRPQPGNPIGFGNIPFRDGEMNLTINAQGHGSYEFQVYDPARFYENANIDISKPFSISEGNGANFIKQMKDDMKPKFQKALTAISAKRIPYDMLGAYPDELADAMNNELTDKWVNKGIKLTSLSIELNVDDESKKRIAKFQEAKTAGSDPSMLYAMDRMSINTAREAAASNSAGAMTGFMGMGMAGGMMGQPMDSTMYQQQMQQNMMNQQMGMQQNPQMNQQPVMNQQTGGQPAPAPSADSWVCACGTSNTSKFCAECGKPKPEPKPAEDSWTCSCGVSNTGKFCAECGNPKPEAQPDGWTCSCGMVNKGKFCAECGSPKPASEPLYKCDKCGWEPSDPKNPPKFCPQCGDPFNENDIQK